MGDITLTQLVNVGTLDAADELAVWDASAALTRKATVSQLQAGLAAYYAGAWTPAIVYATGQSGTTYSVQQGYQFRLGGLCVAIGRIQLSAVGAGSGQVTVTLPYAVSTLYATPALTIASMAAGITVVQGLAISNAISLYKNALTAGLSLLQVSDLTATTMINFTVTYYTTAAP